MTNIKGKISQNAINTILKKNVYSKIVNGVPRMYERVLQSILNSGIACRLSCRVSQCIPKPDLFLNF